MVAFCLRHWWGGESVQKFCILLGGSTRLVRNLDMERSFAMITTCSSVSVLHLHLIKLVLVSVALLVSEEAYRDWAYFPGDSSEWKNIDYTPMQWQTLICPKPTLPDPLRSCRP